MIKIDCFVIPIFFEFEVYDYDYDSKKYKNETNNYLKKTTEYTNNNDIINRITPNIYPYYLIMSIREI